MQEVVSIVDKLYSPGMTPEEYEDTVRGLVDGEIDLTSTEIREAFGVIRDEYNEE
jgi:hypothetical protein